MACTPTAKLTPKRAAARIILHNLMVQLCELDAVHPRYIKNHMGLKHAKSDQWVKDNLPEIFTHIGKMSKPIIERLEKVGNVTVDDWLADLPAEVLDEL